MATQQAPTRPWTRNVAPRVPAFHTEILILENPIAEHHPELGRAVEDEVREVLHSQDLGTLQVRFRLCEGEVEGTKFICKVENPASVPGEGRAPSWRWWSPLLASVEEFRAALEEALEVRQRRLS